MKIIFNYYIHGILKFFVKAGGDDQGALFHLRLRRSRESARDKLLQSLVGLVEAQEVICYIINIINATMYVIF